MTEMSLYLSAAVSFCGGFLAAHHLTKKDMEETFHARELELKNKIAKAMLAEKLATRNYQDLASQIKAMSGANAGASEFNKLYQKVRSQLPNS
jgi:hypothetical protein